MAVATTQSWQEHTSDGSTAYFPFNFNYDTTRPGTIVVGKRTADNTYSVVDASNYELIPNAAGDGGQIRFIQNPSGSQVIDDIPPAGTIIRIERVSVDTSSATWQIGLEMSELVNLFDRLFRLVQENKNNFANVIKTFETQHNISLYELLSEHDNHLLYWDNTTQTLTPTDFPKEDVVRATDGMFLRISTDTAGNPYLEWSLTGTDNWHSVSDTAVEALSKINNHLADKNNPHETSMSKLTDVELTNPSTNQFLSFDGSKWKNVNYNTTVTWGAILGNITDQTDLMNKFAEYVRTDGSSTMTGVLKMRASESFKGAIAPSWDGVGFFKLNDNDSVTLMASMEETDGLTPATNNKYNIGKSAYKWKDLYLAGKAYMSVINNGFDIAVPVTNSADTFALVNADINPLQQQINHLQTIGRFLSFWDATTGLAQTNPQTSPYIYQTGDYFRVGVVASGGGTNYKPTGSSYITGVASTVVETEPLTVGQVYYYDGTNWALAAGGNVAIDGTTIVFNSDNELQAVATVNQNTAAGATNPVYDWVGTLAEYTTQNIATAHPDWLCYITDDNTAQAFDAYSKTESDARYVQQGHQVIEFQAPTAANEYTWYRKYADGWVEQGGKVQLNGTISATNKRVTFPVVMATDDYFAVASQDANTPYTSFVGWRSTTGMSVGTNGASTTGTTTWMVCGMAS